MFGYRTFDQALIARYIEVKLVWPFEYRCYGTRYTITRLASVASVSAMTLAVSLSPLIETLAEAALYVAVFIGAAILCDGFLKRAEAVALALGGQPNPYRARTMLRTILLLMPAVCVLSGFAVLPLHTLEGLFRICAGLASIIGIYTYSADPVPPTWAPRARKINW